MVSAEGWCEGVSMVMRALGADVLGFFGEAARREGDDGDALLFGVLQHRSARCAAVGGGDAAGVGLWAGRSAGGSDEGHFVGAEAGDGRVQGIDAVGVVSLHHLQVADVASFHGGAGVFDGGEEAGPTWLLGRRRRPRRRRHRPLGLVRRCR